MQQLRSKLSVGGAFTNYVDKFLGFFTTYLPASTFLDYLPASSCQRSLWTPPWIKIRMRIHKWFCPKFDKNIVKLFLASCFDGHIDKVAIVVFDGHALIWCQPSVVARYFTGAIMSVKNFFKNWRFVFSYKYLLLF